MTHAQKPDFVFPRNGRLHLNRWGRQFSRLLAAEVCALAWVMLDRPRSEVAWEYWLPTPFASFPFTSPPVRHRVPRCYERPLPSISEAVPPSATWGRAMPWWQGSTHFTKEKKKHYVRPHVSVRPFLHPSTTPFARLSWNSVWTFFFKKVEQALALVLVTDLAYVWAKIISYPQFLFLDSSW